MIISRYLLKLGQLVTEGKKIRLLGQMLGKPCKDSVDHIFLPEFKKIIVKCLIFVASKFGGLTSRTCLHILILEHLYFLI